VTQRNDEKIILGFEEPNNVSRLLTGPVHSAFVGLEIRRADRGGDRPEDAGRRDQRQVFGGARPGGQAVKKSLFRGPPFCRRIGSGAAPRSRLYGERARSSAANSRRFPCSHHYRSNTTSSSFLRGFPGFESLTDLFPELAVEVRQKPGRGCPAIGLGRSSRRRFTETLARERRRRPRGRGTGPSWSPKSWSGQRRIVR